MRGIQAALVLLFLALILSWVPLRSVNNDAASFDQTLSTLDRLSMTENALSRDTLRARAGMLRNYDPLVREIRALNQHLERLKETATKSDRAAIERLAESVDRQAVLIEAFKSNNALLQNSLAYFQIFSRRLGASDDPKIVSAVMALGSSVLQLTLDTSPAAVGIVKDRLAALAAIPPPPDQADTYQGLLAHGGLLQSLLPETDGVLKALYDLPIRAAQFELRTTIQARQSASRVLAERLRLSLYATSVILFGLLIYLARRLRVRARALRERAAFEHLIAGISMRFLSTLPHEIDREIERALARLAASFGAGRAYFIEAGSSVRMRTWCLDGVAFPSGWPEQVPELSDKFEPTELGVLHIAHLDRLPPGSNKDRLAAAGLRGWICMVSPDADGVRRILGFDALAPCRITASADLGFARMALDVLANAAGRQALERERARLETRLQQARRMETVGALASGIAHNFNNIIGAILGYAEMAEGKVVSGSRIAANLLEIRSAGERARDLVDQILDFGRPRHLLRTTIRVNALMAEAASLLRASLPEQIELVVREVPEEAVVAGQPAQLQQVILNLCNNAAQAMSAGGRVGIATSIREVPEAVAFEHGRLEPGRYVSITISDTGRGMDEALAKRIFEPFFTTRQGGNGLGLATVKEIVIDHGGAIRVRSVPEVGSQFQVWLACIAPETPMLDETALLSPPDQLETVLLIDDDRERLHRDEEMLAAIGYEPVGFTRPADALAACRNAPGRFDALLVGHVAPAAALALAEALHESAPGLPILLAMASPGEMTAQALAAAGVREVVNRPLIAAELAEALRRSLVSPEPPLEALES